MLGEHRLHRPVGLEPAERRARAQLADPALPCLSHIRCRRTQWRGQLGGQRALAAARLEGAPPATCRVKQLPQRRTSRTQPELSADSRWLHARTFSAVYCSKDVSVDAASGSTQEYVSPVANVMARGDGPDDCNRTAATRRRTHARRLDTYGTVLRTGCVHAPYTRRVHDRKAVHEPVSAVVHRTS